MNKDRLQNLISLVLSGNATDEQRDELLQWVINDESVEECRRIWDDTPCAISDSKKEALWQSIEEQVIERESSIVPASSPKVVTLQRKWINIAAAIAILLCCGAGLAVYLGYGAHNSSTQIFTFSASRGQKASMRLADGTMVYLNSASSISFDGNYNKSDRKIILEGEAYFEVAKNPDKRFVVSCNGMDVTALGTKFDVKGYSEDGVVTATLAEGKVKVSAMNRRMILKPNECATFDIRNHSLLKSTVDDLAVADYWRTTTLVFNGETLESIARTLERMYGVKIVIRDARLRSIPFSGTIRNNSLQNIFRIISLTYPMTYSMSGDTVWVDSD
jgi:transmembrane sensor